MSIKNKITGSSKSVKLIALALVMAAVAGSLAFAASHNTKQASKNDSGKKNTSSTKTITTKDGKKVTVSNASKLTPEQKAKVAEERFQKRIDSAIKQKRITEAQAKLIRSKAAEVSKNGYSTQDAKARAELQKNLYAWAKDNKIPLSFVFEMSRPRA